MSLQKIHEDQPENFEFNDKNKKILNSILEKYPKKEKKVLSCLCFIWYRARIIIGYP